MRYLESNDCELISVLSTSIYQKIVVEPTFMKAMILLYQHTGIPAKSIFVKFKFRFVT